jgi:hypothetical protein
MGTCRQTLCVGSTSRQSRSAACRRADRPDVAVQVEQAERIDGAVVSRSALSQSTWSVSEYQVKPSTGTPSLRTRSTLAHSFHSQFTASSPSGPSARLVSVCITGRPVAVVVLRVITS